VSAQETKEELLRRAPQSLHKLIEQLDYARRYAWQQFFKSQKELEETQKKLELALTNSKERPK